MKIDALAPALARACVDLNTRAEFYQLLLNAPVFALGQKQGVKVLGKRVWGQKTLLQHWQREDNSGEVIPFFSSLRLLEQAISTPTPYVQVTGREIFCASGATPLILNPFSETNKEFLFSEVAMLRLNGLASVLVSDKGKPTSHLLAGIPHALPRLLKGAILERLKRHDSIEAAYAAQTFNPDDGAPPRLVIALKTTHKIVNLPEELHTVFAPLAAPNQALDLVWLNDDNHPLKNYLINETCPIYRKGAVWNALGRVEQLVGI